MIIKKKVINKISVTTYELVGDQTKPVLFFFHGFTSNKDDGIMGRGEKLAELGFYVVALDAYLHGDRSELWFKVLDNKIKYQYIVDIEIETAKNAVMLYEELLKRQVNIKKDGFYAYGVSMGAATTFYLSTITNKLKAAVTLVGSASFVEYYKERQKKYGWTNDVVKERLEKYQKEDPLINYKKIKNTKIFIALGNNDEVVNPSYSKRLHQLRPDTTILKMYDTGHESTPEMLNDAYDFLAIKDK